jgi:hypothetical protein
MVFRGRITEMLSRVSLTKKNSIQIRQVAPMEDLKNDRRLAFAPGIDYPSSIPSSPVKGFHKLLNTSIGRRQTALSPELINP